MAVVLVSFGFKHGAPREADYCLDCRMLPNPFFVEGLRLKSGLDQEVREFLAVRPEFDGLRERLSGLLEFAIPLHEAEGKPVLTVAFGCTGGRHRSVAVAEAVAGDLRGKGFQVRVAHRDVEGEGG